VVPLSIHSFYLRKVTSMSNQRISADRYTKQQLGIKGNSITAEEAKQVQNKVSDSKEFKAVKEKDELVIKRVIRD
jgi:hypothetical protein